MANWVQRQIDAPAEPFVTEAEVMDLLRVTSSATLLKMIEAGHLPVPLKRSGKNCWAWEDIVYANLAMKLAARLNPLTAVEDDPDAEDGVLPKTVQSRSKSSKVVQDRSSSP